MSEVVARFLAFQSPRLTREALGEEGPNLFGEARACGAAWRELAAEVGVPCPDALVLLGDAMAERYVYFRFRRHQFAMFYPEDARSEREHLSNMATKWTELAPFAAMLPIFGEDGDSLLLDNHGQVWFLLHDDSPPQEPVAPNLDSVLLEASPPVVNL
ncbi:MAG: hypothetical protein U0271_38175 [Polyangiaceae bacterium]